MLKRFFPPPTPQQAAEQAKAAKAAQGQALGVGQTALPTGAIAPGAVGTAVVSGQQAVPMAPAQAAAATEKTVEVDTDYYVAVFTTHGARLESFTLRHYRQNAPKDSPPYEMVEIPPGGHLPLGAVLTRGGQVFDDRDLS